MSTVVGIIDNGKVWMGADSFATTSDGERRRIVCNKIFLNSPYLIGYIGNVRIGQMLDPHYFKPPVDLMDFPDAIYNHFKEKEFLSTNPDTQAPMLECNFLIATIDGKLYEILADYQMNQIIDYTAIGSGSPFALGSLYTSRKSSNNGRRINLALEAAALYDVSTGPPFVIEEFLEDK